MLTMVASRPTMSRLIEQMPRMTSRVRRSGTAWWDSAWALTLLDPRPCLWPYDDGPIAGPRPPAYRAAVTPGIRSAARRPRPRASPPAPAWVGDSGGPSPRVVSALCRTEHRERSRGRGACPIDWDPG